MPAPLAWWPHIFGTEKVLNSKRNRSTKNWPSRKPCTSSPGNYTPDCPWVLLLAILIGLCSRFVHYNRLTTGCANRANIAWGGVAPLLGSATNGFCCSHKSKRPSPLSCFLRGFLRRWSPHGNCSAVCQKPPISCVNVLLTESIQPSQASIFSAVDHRGISHLTVPKQRKPDYSSPMPPKQIPVAWAAVKVATEVRSVVSLLIAVMLQQ